MVSVDAARGSDLLSSIALVRELLKDDPHHVNTELSVARQLRYNDRLMVEEEQKAHREIVEDLQFRLEQAKQEARQEKVIRMSLEETNEALEQHTAELSACLDSLTASAAPPSGPSEPDPAHVESIKLLEAQNVELNLKLAESQKEVDTAKTSAKNWMNNYHQAQRQVKDMQAQLETMKKEFQTIQNRQEYLLHGKSTKYESFQKRLEDSVSARRNAQEGLHSIRGIQADTRHDERIIADPSEIPDWKLKYEEALASTTRVEAKASRLEAEVMALTNQRGAPSFSGRIQVEGDGELMEKLAALNELYAKAKMDLSANEAKISSKATAALRIKLEECIAEFKRIHNDLKNTKPAAENEDSKISDAPREPLELLGAVDEAATLEEAPSVNQGDEPLPEVAEKTTTLVAEEKVVGSEKRAPADSDGAASKRRKAK